MKECTHVNKFTKEFLGRKMEDGSYICGACGKKFRLLTDIADYTEVKEWVEHYVAVLNTFRVLKVLTGTVDIPDNVTPDDIPKFLDELMRVPPKEVMDGYHHHHHHDHEHDEHHHHHDHEHTHEDKSTMASDIMLDSVDYNTSIVTDDKQSEPVCKETISIPIVEPKATTKKKYVHKESPFSLAVKRSMGEKVTDEDIKNAEASYDFDQVSDYRKGDPKLKLPDIDDIEEGPALLMRDSSEFDSIGMNNDFLK